MTEVLVGVAMGIQRRIKGSSEFVYSVAHNSHYFQSIGLLRSFIAAEEFAVIASREVKTMPC